MDRQNTLLFSRAGSLDRKLADIRKLKFGELKKAVMAANETHDCSDIYAVPSETTPPLPPHRCPSWESRIYAIASTGITSLTSTPTHSMRVARNAHTIKSALLTDRLLSMLNERSAPVFATVKGRASRIRSIPFTGESTDSSDDETEARITGTSMTTESTSSSGHESDLFVAQAVTPVRNARRGVSDECELLEDYSLPPDALMSISMDAIGKKQLSHETAAQKRFSSLQRPAAIRSQNNDVLEKSGYLTKLGGKLKTWRRLWFVLKDGVLSYYKYQSDANRCKPRGEIVLDKYCRLTTATDSATFQIITINKKVHYLTADSVSVLEEWICLIQNVLKRSAVFQVRDDQKPTYESWVVKVKHGHSKRCWCALYGRFLVYFKSPIDSNPVGQTDLKGAKVKEVDNISDSDNEDNVKLLTDETNDSQTESEYTIVIFQKLSSEPIYLLLSSKQELDSWLYHLSVVLSGEHLAGTPFEHLISRLMVAETESIDTLDGLSIWKNPLLLYSKENISESLTTLPNEYLRIEAIKLFKSIQLFISVPLDSAGIDYHVSLVQNSLQLCLNNHELRSELYLQLAKQTTPHTNAKLCGSSGVQQFLLCATQTIFTCDSSNNSSEKTSPTSLNEIIDTLPTCDKLNPPNIVLIQAFQFLSLAVSLFLPQNRTLWYLRQHFRRLGDVKSDIGKYAIYCERALERTLKNGGREFRPSRMEVLSIFLRNPYHHSLPHSIPVNFVNSSYNVVGFDGSSTIQEFCQLLNSEVGIRENCYSGFALYSDDPIDKNSEHLLDSHLKLADIIAKWEVVLREKHLGKFENTRVIKLTYKHRLCLRSYIKSETDKERLFFVYEINNEIMNARFPVNYDLGLELTALIAQIEFGDFVHVNRTQIILQHTIDRFFPNHLREGISIKLLSDSIRNKWMELRGRSILECVRIYLNCARKWPFCGSKLFEAKLSRTMKVTDSSSSYFGIMDRYSKLWISISDDSIALLDWHTFHVIKQYPYNNLITFGGCKDDFMIVVTNKSIAIESDSGSGSASGCSRVDSIKSERLLFIMPKTKIVEITLLIADYINADTSRLNISNLIKNSDNYNTYSFDKFSQISGHFSRGQSLKYVGKSSLTKL